VHINPERQVMVISTIRCPFCTEGQVKAEPGKAVCQECNAKFEIDDRVECVFVDLNNPGLPLKGTYCRSCGLVQGVNRKRCHYCGAIVKLKLQ